MIPKPPAQVTANWLDTTSCILAGVGLMLVLWLHLLPALLAGLLVYELIHILTPFIQRHLSGQRAKIVAVAFLSTLVVGLVAAAIVGAIAFFRSDAGNIAGLLSKIADIIDGSRGSLPGWVLDKLPASVEELKLQLGHWLREHGGELQLAGKEAIRSLAHILVGLIIGAMIALYDALPVLDYRPLSRVLIERASRLARAFRRIVFAQIRISALNTIFTAIYLLVVLPLMAVKLPLGKTLILITFVAGLLPVIGNLISNTIIVLVSMAHSLHVAAGSLLFLILIHKFEYFLNARIVGSHIHARAWELLLAMLVMEAAFGLPGVVAAPIYYAWLKDELTLRELV